MDIGRLDTLRHLLSVAPSRRVIGRALAALTLSGGVATLAGLGDAEAKKKCKKKKKCPKLPSPPFCAGKNSCFADGEFLTCQDSGDVCGCFVAVETGTTFCGKSAGGLVIVDNCSECPAGTTCIYGSGGSCGDFPLLCAEPCPDPL